jgi:hypothetical protein
MNPEVRMSVTQDHGAEMPPEIAEAIAKLENQRHEADRIRQAVDQLVVKGATEARFAPLIAAADRLVSSV